MTASSPTYTYGCTLIRVIDGDTVMAEIDLGFRSTMRLPIRLLGLNAPEHNTVAGQQAITFVKRWFATHDRLVIVTQKSPEKYGRWLGVISGQPNLDHVTSSADDNLNEALLAGGHAVAYGRRGSMTHVALGKRGLVPADSDKPHRCPFCGGIPDKAHTHGHARWSATYRCAACDLWWWRGYSDALIWTWFRQPWRRWFG